MTDHAQREALIRAGRRAFDYAQHVHGCSESKTDVCDCGLAETAKAWDAALRASASPAPECPICDEPVAPGDNSYTAHRECRPAPHTARTALGEPPTGMREVPGTPGLYVKPDPVAIAAAFAEAEIPGVCDQCGKPLRPSEATWFHRDCLDAYHAERVADEAKPPLDLDALASEIWRRLKSKVVPLRIYPDPQPEIVAIIRAALDRVKEGK